MIQLSAKKSLFPFVSREGLKHYSFEGNSNEALALLLGGKDIKIQFKEKKPASVFGLKKGFSLGAGKKKESAAPKDEFSIEIKPEQEFKVLSVWKNNQEKRVYRNEGSKLFLSPVGLQTEGQYFPLIIFPVGFRFDADEMDMHLWMDHYEIYAGKQAFQELSRLDVQPPELHEIREEFDLEKYIIRLRELLLSVESGFKVTTSLCFFPGSYEFEVNSKTATETHTGFASPGVDLTQFAGFVPGISQQLNELIEKDTSLTIRNAGLRRNLLLEVIHTLLCSRKRVLLVSESNTILDHLLCGLKDEARPLYVPFHKVRDRDSFLAILEKSRARLAPDPEAKIETIDEFPHAFLDYVERLNSEMPNFEKSISEVLLDLFSDHEIPALPISMDDVFSVDESKIEQWLEQLKSEDKIRVEYQQIVNELSQLVDHEHLDATTIKVVNELMEEARSVFSEVEHHLEEVCKAIGISGPESLNEINTFKKNVDFILNAPAIPVVSLHHSWSPIPKEVNRVIKILEYIQEREREIGHYFRPEILKEDLQELVPRLQMDNNASGKILNFKFKRDLKRIKGYLYGHTEIEKDPKFWANLRSSASLQKLREDLKNLSQTATQYFGSQWDRSDFRTFKAANAVVEWLSHFERRRINRFVVDEETFREVITDEKREMEVDWQLLDEASDKLNNTFRELEQILNPKEGTGFQTIREVPFDELNRIIDQLHSINPRLKRLSELRDELKFYAAPMIRDFRRIVEKRDDIDDQKIEAVLRKSILKKVVETHLASEAVLSNMVEDDLIQSFQDLVDFYLNRKDRAGQALRSSLAALRAESQKSMKSDKGYSVLQHELRKNANRIPVSLLLDRAQKAVSGTSLLWSIRDEQLPLLHPIKNEFDAVLTYNLKNPDDPKLLYWIADLPQLHFKRAKPPKKKAAFGIGIQKSEEKSTSLEDMIPDLSEWSAPPELEYIRCEEGELGKTASLMARIKNHFSPESTIAIDENSADFGRQVDKIFLKGSLDEDLKYLASCIRMDQNVLADHPASLLIHLVAAQQDESKPSGFTLGAKPKKSEPKSKVNEQELITLPNDRVLVMHEGALELSSSEKSEDGSISNVLLEFVSGLGESREWNILSGEGNFDLILRHTDQDISVYVYCDAGRDPDQIKDDLFRLTQRFNHFLLVSLRELAQDPEDVIGELFDRAEKLISKPTSAASVDHEIDENERPESLESIEDKNQATDQIHEKLNRVFQPPSGFEFPKSKSRKGAVAPSIDALPDIDDYKLHDGILMGDRNAFFDSGRRIRKLISEVVQVEGPIYWKFLLRTVASYWQISRVDKNVESVFLKQLEDSISAKEVFLKDQCLYPTSNFEFKVRSRINIADIFYPNEIPLDEIEAAFLLILEKQQPLGKADLFMLASHLFGLPIQSAEAKPMLEKALVRMGMEGVILEAKNGYVLKDELISSQNRLKF